MLPEGNKGAASSSALGYTLRIALAVLVAEAGIMLLLSLFHVRSVWARAALDSVLLVVILLPSLHRLVYKPLAEQIKKDILMQQELQLSRDQLGDHARMLESLVEKKVAEQKHTDARYKAILESSNDGIIIADSEMTIIFCNPMAEAVFGYSPGELAGRQVTELVPERHKARHASGFSAFLDSGQIRKGQLHQTEGLRKDGSELPIEISFSPYRSGSALFVTAIIRDVTERQRSESSAKKHCEQLSGLRNICLAISGTLDLNVTLNVILDQMVSLLDIDAVDVLLFNETTLRLEYHGGRGFRTEALRHTSLRLGEGFAGKAAEEFKSLFLEDLAAAHESFRSPDFKQEGFMSYCCIPLISKGLLQGTLEIFSRKPLKFAPELKELLGALALHAAIAIDNATMFDSLYKSKLGLMLAYETTLEGWSRALDLRDKETEGHSRRVTDMTVRMARELGLDEARIMHVRWGALLHDIGKMGIPDQILLKPGPLTDEEWDIMRRHPVYAYDLLLPIEYLRPALDIPYCHHEKWDGSGYPRGLRGEEIPLAARIFTVVDVWDALHSVRPYREPWPSEKIRQYIASESGSQFDPKVVEIFLKTKW